jgi:rhodanese-related sulfurtransferase
MFARLMGLETVSPRGLYQLMQREPVTVVDVNARPSWVAARVRGAVHLDPAGFDARDLPADRDATLVFYCSNVFCTKAPRAARRATAMGFRRVLVMSAGIRGWLDAALPTESGEGGSRSPTPRPG